MKKIPSVIVPIISNGNMNDKNLFDLFKGKKNIIFGVPGAFTPTCSEQHLPGFLKLSNIIKSKGIDDIYCMSVNDKYVMNSWLLNNKAGEKIIGIADGNAEISRILEVIIDKKENFMGIRCMRFVMIVDNNVIKKIFLDESGKFEITSAENLLKNI